MGKTTSKKMIPLLILRILWKHADKENMVTMDFICNRLGIMAQLSRQKFDIFIMN